jgi:hypothetical protein
VVSNNVGITLGASVGKADGTVEWLFVGTPVGDNDGVLL